MKRGKYVEIMCEIFQLEPNKLLVEKGRSEVPFPVREGFFFNREKTIFKI